MPDTPISLITYPASSNAPNVPSDMQGMANDIDSIVIPRFANASARNTAFSSPVDGNHCWLNDLHRLQVYRDSYSAWQNYTMSIMRVKTSTETVTGSTVLQDDDVITGMPFKPATRYFLRGFLICQSPSAAGIKLFFSVSQTPVSGFWCSKITTTGNNVGGLASANFGVAQGLATQSGTDFCTIEGVIDTHATNSGTIKLQWAQNVSNGGNTQIHPGSHIELVEAV